MNKFSILLSIVTVISTSSIALYYSYNRDIAKNEIAKQSATKQSHHFKEWYRCKCESCTLIYDVVYDLFSSLNAIYNKSGSINKQNKEAIKNALENVIKTSKPLLSNEYSLTCYIDWNDLAIAFLIAYNDLDEATKSWLLKALNINKIGQLIVFLENSNYKDLNIIKESRQNNLNGINDNDPNLIKIIYDIKNLDDTLYPSLYKGEKINNQIKNRVTKHIKAIIETGITYFESSENIKFRFNYYTTLAALYITKGLISKEDSEWLMNKVDVCSETLEHNLKIAEINQTGNEQLLDNLKNS